MKKKLILAATLTILTSCAQGGLGGNDTGTTTPGTGTTPTTPGTGTTPTTPGTGTTPTTPTPTPTPATEHSVKVGVSGVEEAKIKVADQNDYVLQEITVKSEYVLKLKAGTYKLIPSAVSGYNTPAAKTMTVTGDTGYTFVYTKTVAPTPKPNTDIELTPANPAAGDKLMLIAQQDQDNNPVNRYYARGGIVVNANAAANGADCYEVFLSHTAGNFDASNRRYNTCGVTEGNLTINTATEAKQGENNFLVIRYWKDGKSFTKSAVILPDNEGPQVPDIMRNTNLSLDMTNKLGHWVNKTITMAFENVADLRDNPTSTTFKAAGIDRVEYWLDTKVDGVANVPVEGTPCTAYAVVGDAVCAGVSTVSPYSVRVDTTKIKDGKYEVYAVAYDKLGNRNITRAQNLYVLGIDNTGPVYKGGFAFAAKDAGTGGVLDEMGLGKTTGVYSVREKCIIDGEGNIDLFDSLPKGAGGHHWISGIAHVTLMKSSAAYDDGNGVGLSSPKDSQSFWSIDGEPLVNRLYVRNAAGNLVLRGSTADITETECVYLDVNGTDAGEVNVRYNPEDISTDLLGNPSTGKAPITDVKIYVDNQRPTNLRFTRFPDMAIANKQIELAMVADDSLAGINEARTQFFGRATNGKAFDGRAVQLVSRDKLYYRIFNPEVSGSTSSNILDILGVVVDNAGNVSSTKRGLSVAPVAGPLVGQITQDNFFVRRRGPNNDYPNFDAAINENPVRGPVGTIHRLDILNTPMNGLPNLMPFVNYNVQYAGFHQEVLLRNPLNRIGYGTADAWSDDLNLTNTQDHAPLFFINATESAPYVGIKVLEGGLASYYASVVDKNGWVKTVRREIQY